MTPPNGWFVLFCLDCDEACGVSIVMPFTSAAKRGRWAAEHTRWTGHSRFDVVDQPKEVLL